MNSADNPWEEGRKGDDMAVIPVYWYMAVIRLLKHGNCSNHSFLHRNCFSLLTNNNISDLCVVGSYFNFFIFNYTSLLMHGNYANVLIDGSYSDLLICDNIFWFVWLAVIPNNWHMEMIAFFYIWQLFKFIDDRRSV